MFFDTTSIYFEGEGGEELGQYGHSKDHRPDRKQMVVGAMLDGAGAADLLRAVAGQRHRREDADSRGGPAAAAVPHPLDLHRGRPGHDQPGDDRPVAGPSSGKCISSWGRGCGT